jgi:monofunctional biosynthetic peptidoglycan transglycosylase
MLKIRLSKRKKTWLIFLMTISVFILAFSIFIRLGSPDVQGLNTTNPEETSLMKMRIKQAQIRGDTLEIKQNWISFKQIPDLFKNAVRITEDSSFYWHKGVDFNEIKESIKKNIREKKWARGGSTITHQLAKTLSKDRIFELYLNVIEFGPGIFGVQAASQHYFERDVNALNVEQIIRLTAIIPRPMTTDPRGDDPWLKWKCRWILNKLKVYKYITDEIYNELLQVFSTP